MSPPREVDEVFVRTVDFLEREGVPYVLMGGVAVNVWGIPRFTADVDFEVKIPRDEIPRILRAADEDGFVVDPAQAAGFVESLSAGMPVLKLVYWHGEKPIRIDLLLSETQFLNEVFSRRVLAEYEGRRCYAATGADMLLFKLLAWRLKDRADIENLLTVQGVPEEPYLRSWAARLGVTDRLERALAEHRSGG